MTVVIPVFNGAGTIIEALESVRAQTWTDWQVLVSDDCSTDETVALVEALEDPQIRVLRSEVNTGPGGARNRALALADTELVAFLDADDIWLPTYLEKQVRRYDHETACAGHPVGIVACNAFVEEGGTGERSTYYELFGRGRVDPVTVDSLLRRNTIFISCLIPREVGETVGWFDPSLFVSEDYDLWLRIVEGGYRVVIEWTPLAAYRRTTTSISRNTERQAAHNQRVITRALARGNLTARQRRIARSELRYNRALEVVAAAAFHGRRPRFAEVPNALWVAASRPRHWRDWAESMRSK